MTLKIRFIALLFFVVFATSAQTNYTLQRALQTAKANNPFLKTQYFNITIAETDILAAKMRPNPILNNQSLQLMAPSYFPANTEWHNGLNRQVWWQLTKSFQLPGERKHKILLAEKNVAYTQKSYSDIERNLFYEVASKWLDVWTAKKQLDILQLAKNNTDSLVNINKLRLKNQVITQTDLARTELLSNQYSLQIKSAEQLFKSELLNFKILIGVQENAGIDTSDTFNYIFSSSIDSLLQQALSNRTDVQVIKASIDVTNSNIVLQKQLKWPNPELGVIYNPQNTIPYMGFFGTIQIPIFSRNQSEIKKSYILKQQAEQELNTTQQKIQSEIANAFNNYQTHKLNLQGFDVLIKQSENILSSVKYSYLKGGTTIIDYLEAQRSWLETQQQYFETLQIYRQSYIQLLFASGLINQLAQ